MQFGYASRIVAIATLLRWKSRRSTQPASVMALRYWTESPAMLPNAHVACSLTPSLGESTRRMRSGSAPLSITAAVYRSLKTTTIACSFEPEAMLVSTQADSYCRLGQLSYFRKRAKRGTNPVLITRSIGG